MYLPKKRETSSMVYITSSFSTQRHYDISATTIHFIKCVKVSACSINVLIHSFENCIATPAATSSSLVIADMFNSHSRRTCIIT